MYNLYVLCLYGISLRQVKNLVKSGLSLKDFEDRTEKINELINHKPTLVRKIDDIIPIISDVERADNLYQLAHMGLSEVIIKNLIDLNISYFDINELTLEKFSEMNGGNRKSVYKKIISSFEKVEQSKGRISNWKLRELILDILNNLKLDEIIHFNKIEELISSESHLKINRNAIQSVLKELHSTKYIIYDSNEVKRYYPKLTDFIRKEFKDKKIFIERLQGKTLSQLANYYQYSRQGIRNIEKRVLKRMPFFEEELRYNETFGKFDIEQDLFCNLFQEPPEVYNYLNLKYDKGNKCILDDVFNPKFTEVQRRQILRYYNVFLNKKGEIKELSKISIFDEVVSKYAINSVTDAEIVDKFNEYIIKNNLPRNYLSDESSLRGISDRCQLSIKGKGNTYRYYDFEVITNEAIGILKELIEVEPGVYSMRKIFSENPEIMNEFDIRTEHELHNLYRRMIDVDGVIYNRMPEFTIGNVTKREFLVELFKEYSPIPLKEFAEFVEEVYGLRQDSLTSFILSNLNNYIYEDVIKTDYIELSDEEYYQLKNLLTRPIYTMEEIKKLGSSITHDFGESFINNMTLSKVGYQIRSNFVLSNIFNSVDEYFRNMILSQDYFVNEHLPVYQTQSFKVVIYNLEKNFEIFKIETDIYITFKKLSHAGISLDDIMDYKRALLEFIEEDENKYFTLLSIREEGFEHPLDDLGFPNTFYERLIWAFEEFRAVQTSTGYILKKTDGILSLREFLYDYVSERRVVKLEGLIDEIKDIYGIFLDTTKVIYSLKQTDVFYSEEMFKFYIDKEDFYEEVYE
ncbi:hypothetical protein [Salinibacillus xinjiangensis]|uniref:RNA polymerase sigma-70 region 4 domain-containing protein n=1 Tax=Salinibacillus xinjiangensis TaxID=1229268 RepID=A0A6G1X4P9_9BACI|nr:hypothetical protein [Salinibacillus xinjiangensis]MRG85973.1 hypothetical protein [Salinibacillus xinjiangensis]